MPKVLPANKLAVYMLSKYLPVYIDGMGGINADGIRLTMEAEHLAGNTTILKKLIHYCIDMLKVTNSKDRQNGK